MPTVMEARPRLDRALSAPALSDAAMLSSRIRERILKTNAEELATDEVVEKKCRQLLKLLDALRSANRERSTEEVEREWKVKQDTPRFRVLYREGPAGTPYHSLCLDGIIDGPMSHALCVAWEVTMFKKWWPQYVAPTFKIVESRWLERDTVGGDHAVLRFKIPWPFAMREVILSAFELEYFDEDLIAVLYKSAPDVTDEKIDGISSNQIPALDANAVRMDVDGGFVLQRIDDNCSVFRIVVDIDMKIDIVPPWLINFLARQLIGHGYKLYQKAVSGVRGSILEALANSNSMYKRIQDFDHRSLHEKVLMLSEEVTAIKKGLYSEDEIDSMDAALEAFSDQGSSKAYKQKLEVVQIQGKQRTDTPLKDIVSHSNDAAHANGLPNGNHESHPDRFELLAGIDITAMSAERELLPGRDETTDSDVKRAIQFLDKCIARCNARKAAAQTSESRDTSGVQNGTSDNSESVRSTATADSPRESLEYVDAEEWISLQHETGPLQWTIPSGQLTAGAAVANSEENGTKQSHDAGSSDRVKRVGSDKTTVAFPGGQQFVQLPHTHQRGFRFFNFRKRHKDRDKNSSKKPEQPQAGELFNLVYEM